MDNETLKPFIKICTIALVAMTIVCSISIAAMCIQSNKAMEEGREAFRILYETDYQYGEITQSTDVQIGE